MKVKKQTFVKGILTVLVGQILVKVVSFLYRVVITNFEGFGDDGNGYSAAAYRIYMVLLSIATIGVPTAIAKLVSEKIAVGDKRGAYRIFKIALKLFTVIGVVFCILLAVSSKFIAEYVLSNSGVTLSIIGLAPAIVFVAITAVYRGFFTGLNDLRPHSISQVVEQIFNGIFSVLFVFLLLSKTPEVMAMGFSLGTSASTLISVLYLGILYKSKKKDIIKEFEEEAQEEQEKVSSKVIIRNILKLSIPIAFASIIMSVSTIIDFATVMRGLKTFVTEVEANRQLRNATRENRYVTGAAVICQCRLCNGLSACDIASNGCKGFCKCKIKSIFLCAIFSTDSIACINRNVNYGRTNIKTSVPKCK